MKMAVGLFGAVAAAAALVAATNNGRSRYEVSGHTFEVPSEYLFDHPIWFLDPPERDSFVFLFEPNPEPNQIPKHRVLVERLSRFCPGDASQMLRIICGQEKTAVSDGPPYEKVQDEFASWSSDLYSVEAGPGADGVIDRRQVAFCQLFEPNPAKPYPSTLCTTSWAYEGLMLQFSFDEEEAARVPAMKRHAERLLDSWKVS
jgi:hypothetical protein